MSYCVNCGVELDSTAKKCALCDTPVYNPALKSTNNEPTPFSRIPMIPTNIKQKFVALIITYILLIPNIVCTLINLLVNPHNLWFVYVLSSSFLVWVVFIFPFFTKKLHPYIMWAFDTITIALYVFVFHAKNLGGEKWYLGIALPTILTVSLCVLFFIYWGRKKKRHWTSKMLLIFIELVISLSALCVCLYIAQHMITFDVFIVIDACCLALVFFWLYSNRSKKVRAWLGRKIFV
ncbi:MAG: hypothetical protein IJ025_00610 [Clostridia bacterium]|nr:hypothetical protein [Clostridia bacterium]